MLNPWAPFLYWLGAHVGESGLQCRRPHVEPGAWITVRLVNDCSRYRSELGGVVSSVTGDGDARVTHIVLREVDL